MKKLLSLVLVLSFAFMLVACGNGTSSAGEKQAESSPSVQEEASTPEWMQFVKEFDEFADEYIEVIKVDNRELSDESLQKRSEMTEEYGEWVDKSIEMNDKLKESVSAEEFTEYLNKINEITAKISEASRE